MKDKQPILSICIPTYNRAEILHRNLEGIWKQVQAIESDEVELLVSDNCSPDHTPDVVDAMVKQGMPITYNRNEENKGADRNFLKCMHMAKGKYIYLLGDDDFLADDAISKLLNVLRGNDYGLVYLDTRSELDGSVKVYNDRNAFIKQVSYFYTFMSGCIFRKDAVDLVKSPERYISSCLLQMPFYLQSTLLSENNVVIRFPILGQKGVDANNNGGYNFFKVFVQNYQTIMGEYIQDVYLLKWIKKDIWPFVWRYTRRLLLEKNVGGFMVDDGWDILFKYYGREWYFWWYLFRYPFGVVKRKIKKK